MTPFDRTQASSIDSVVEALGLSAHPEGGWYRETWRSAERVGVSRNGTTVSRAAFTSIVFALGEGERSHFHRIDSDELWVWQQGAHVVVHLLEPGAGYRRLVVAAPGDPHGAPQVVVPGGVWFGAECAAGAAFAVVACVVAPGFEFSAFELAERDALTALWPEHGELIARFTRG